eukprot:s269_g21.t1
MELSSRPLKYVQSSSAVATTVQHRGDFSAARMEVLLRVFGNLSGGKVLEALAMWDSSLVRPQIWMSGTKPSRNLRKRSLWVTPVPSSWPWVGAQCVARSVLWDHVARPRQHCRASRQTLEEDWLLQGEGTPTNNFPIRTRSSRDRFGSDEWDPAPVKPRAKGLMVTAMRSQEWMSQVASEPGDECHILSSTLWIEWSCILGRHASNIARECHRFCGVSQDFNRYYVSSSESQLQMGSWCCAEGPQILVNAAMGLLRSEQMKYGLLVLPVNEAHRIVSRLGKDATLQFEDDNARDMKRPYRKHIQRIEAVLIELTQAASSSQSGQPVDSQQMKQAALIRSRFRAPSHWVMCFGWCLAACAGAANVVAFKSWNLYASHVTGSTSNMAFRIELCQAGETSESLQEACWLVFSFVLGAYACGLLIDHNYMHLGKTFYAFALLLTSALLVLSSFLRGRLLPACLVAAACGLQNAMCTTHFGGIVRTSHVTGTVTDLGSILGRISMIYLQKRWRQRRLSEIEQAEMSVDYQKLTVLAGLWSSYFLGGLGGVYMENIIPGAPQRVLLLPAAGTGLLGLMPCKHLLMEYHQEGVESKLLRAREGLTDLRQRLQRLRPEFHSELSEEMLERGEP